MAPEVEMRDGNIDYAKLLDEELQTCLLPSVKDTDNATVDDIVKDLHRMVTGNGGITRGLIFKVASANVNTRLLQKDMGRIESTVDQLKADHIQEAADEKAQKNITKKVGKAIWDNRSMLLILVVTGLMYFNQWVSAKSRDIPVVKPAQLEKLIHSKVEKLLLGKPLVGKND